MHVDLLLDPFGARWTEVRDAATRRRRRRLPGDLDLRPPRRTGVRRRPRAGVLDDLSALAAVVPSVVLGPMVLNVANRHPGVLAAMAATLQHVSEGRLLLGTRCWSPAGIALRAASKKRSGDPCSAPPSDAGRSSSVWRSCIGLWRAPGFLHPDPEPPVVIAAFGPKMAEIAGRVGDGINARATHPHLRDLVTTARRASRDPDGFLVTVFADFDERWLSPDDPGRRELDALGAHRLILAMTAPLDRRRIAAAGPFLAG